jgi:septation ring formation regulator EzrA
MPIEGIVMTVISVLCFAIAGYLVGKALRKAVDRTIDRAIDRKENHK